MSDLALFVATVLRDRVCAKLLRELDHERELKRQLLRIEVRGGYHDELVAVGRFDQGKRLTRDQTDDHATAHVWSVKLDHLGGCIPIRQLRSITLVLGVQRIVPFQDENDYYCQLHQTADP